MLRDIEIRPGHYFTCDDCGRDQLVYFAEIDPERTADVLAAGGVEPGDEEAAEAWLAEVRRRGGCYVVPDSVRCGHCGAEFAPVPAEDDGEID